MIVLDISISAWNSLGLWRSAPAYGQLSERKLLIAAANLIERFSRNDLEEDP
jgi:hypothetical protein